MENIAEFYYEQLKSTNNAGQLLMQFYGELTGKTTSKADVIMFNKLIKVFGRFTVFFATMELGKREASQITDTPYALIYTICKGRFENEFNSISPASSIDLNKELSYMEKEIERVKRAKIKLPDSSKLGEIDSG